MSRYTKIAALLAMSLLVTDATVIPGSFSWQLANPLGIAQIGTVNTAASLTVAAGTILLTGMGAAAGSQGLYLTEAGSKVALLSTGNIQTAFPDLVVQTNGSNILMVASALLINNPLTNVITVAGSSGIPGSINSAQSDLLPIAMAAI